MYDWLLQAVDAFVDSPWLPILVFLVLTGGAFLPGLPGGTTLLAATAAAAPQVDRVSLVAGAALLGAVIGDVIGHAIGRRYGTKILAARWLRRTRRSVLRARTAMRRRPTVVLAGGRFLPAGRLTGVLAAGISLVPVRRMLRTTIPVAIIWSAWMTFLGVLGDQLAQRHSLSGPVAAWVLSAIITSCVVAGGAVITRRRSVRRAHQALDAAA